MKLQLLLRPEARTPEGKAAVRRICESLGIQLTAEGGVTFSANINDDQFSTLFGHAADARAAALTAPPLKVPDQLREFIETISVPPSHIYMGRKPM